MFANGPGDLGSIPGCVIPKTFKMVLDTYLLNTQQYKVGIGVVAIEKGAFWLPSTMVAPFTLLTYIQLNRAVGLMSRVFANNPGDRGSIPGRVIPKTQKMLLDAALLNTLHYKARIKSKNGT